MIKLSCHEIRTCMLVASVAQMVVAIVVAVVGASSVAMCTKNRHGDWGMVYGAALFAASAVTTAAIHGRQRRVALIALGFSVVTSITVLLMDGIIYFCMFLRSGVNRRVGSCESAVETFNSCSWTAEWIQGIDHFETVQETRLVLLALVVMHLVCSVGLITSALTEAGRIDLCQFEEALRELQDVNAFLSYRKRARRNRILTQYITRAKPEEGQTYVTKLLRFFGFGTDVEPVPVAERKVKIVLPPGASPLTF